MAIEKLWTAGEYWKLDAEAADCVNKTITVKVTESSWASSVAKSISRLHINGIGGCMQRESRPICSIQSNK